MDHWAWLTTGGTSLLVALLGYLKRGRIRQGISASWIARRLNVERDLIRCRAEIADMAASYQRQRSDMAAELATRDREREYLKLVISVLTEEAEKVLKARREGLVTTSDASPSAPSPSPASSPNSPTKPTPTPADRS